MDKTSQNCTENINIVWDQLNKIEKVLLLNNINRYIVKSEHMETTSEMDTGMGGVEAYITLEAFFKGKN